MPKSYSLDLRERVERFVRQGHSRRAAARHFAVSPSFVINLVANAKKRGTLAARLRGGAQWNKLEPYRTFLVSRVEDQPDVTLQALTEELKDRFGFDIHLSSVSRLLRRCGFTYKKNRYWRQNSAAAT